MADREVDVAVLGPVQFTGIAQPFRRSAARELVAYLAFHPQGARNDAWADALWPTRLVPQSTVDSTVCDARRALGRGADGAPRLVRDERRLRLTDRVGTDVGRFAALASSPDPLSWRKALGLIRGVPFSGLFLADWVVFEGIGARVESMVATTALKAAAHALTRHRGDEAEWLVRRALLACPYDERLYRALLRSADAQGSRAGVHSVMAELRVLSGGAGLSDPGGPDHAQSRWHWIHPRTEALYRELTQASAPGVKRPATRL
jgi:DNA-binding SARP family transcriptional activator